MNLQQQPQLNPNPKPKPQPIRVSLDAPTEQIYGLARNLRGNEARRREFAEFPQALLQEYGLETNAISWELGKHGGGKKHGDPSPNPPGGGKHKGDDDSDAEVVAACVAIASDVVVGVIVCGVLAVIDDPPIEGIES
jgi:hypothetical protein